MWDNSADNGLDSIAGNADATYSDIELEDPEDVFPGTGNINEDPQFVNPDSDFRLQSTSPCIDEGNANNTLIRDDVEDIDQDGFTFEEQAPDVPLLLRVNDGDGDGMGWVVDMGCYEFHPSACSTDLNGDGVTDLIDLSEWYDLGPCPGICPPCGGDFNDDCIIDIEDLLVLLNSWGPCTAPGSVDRPQSVQACIEQANGHPARLLACLEALFDLGGGG